MKNTATTFPGPAECWHCGTIRPLVKDADVCRPCLERHIDQTERGEL